MQVGTYFLLLAGKWGGRRREGIIKTQCHPERSEGARYTNNSFEILHYVQNDKY